MYVVHAKVFLEMGREGGSFLSKGTSYDYLIICPSSTLILTVKQISMILR